MDLATRLILDQTRDYEYEPDDRLCRTKEELMARHGRDDLSHYLHVQKLRRDLLDLDDDVVAELLLDQPESIMGPRDWANIDPATIPDFEQYQDFLEAEGFDMDNTELLQGMVDIYEAGLYEYLRHPNVPLEIAHRVRQILDTAATRSSSGSSASG